MIFLFVWFWLVFVAVITVYSFFQWFVRELVRADRVRFAKKNLKEKLASDQDKRDFAKFLKDYLKHDGIFVLRLIGENANKIVLAEVLDVLWQRYRRELRYKEKGEELNKTGEGTLV